MKYLHFVYRAVILKPFFPVKAVYRDILTV